MAKPKKYKIVRNGQQKKPKRDPLYFLGIDLAAQAEKLSNAVRKCYEAYRDGRYTQDKGLFWIGVFAALAAFIGVYYVRQQTMMAAETARKQFQAYLSVSPVGVFCTDCSSDAPAWEARIKLENSGTTPAQDVKICHIYDFIPKDKLPRLSDYTCNGFVVLDVANTGIGANSSRTISLPIDERDLAEAKEIGYSLVITGIIGYTDTFHQSQDVRFCFIHRPVKGKPNTFVGCAEPNNDSADEHGNDFE